MLTYGKEDIHTKRHGNQLRTIEIFKGFETTRLASLHSRKFTLQAKLEKHQVAPPGFEPGTIRVSNLACKNECSGV